VRYPISSKATGSCGICLDTDTPATLTTLSCSHTFHIACLKKQVTSAWSGKDITFTYLSCGYCRTKIDTTDVALAHTISTHRKLESQVLIVKEAECKEADEAAQVAEMAAFICDKCAKPYCGGKKECGAAGEGADLMDFLCKDCAFASVKTDPVGKDRRCQEHGPKFAVYKCDFCCDIATYDCSGTHFCSRCHARPDFGNKGGRRKGCLGRACDDCPLSMEHPPPHNSKNVWEKSENKHFVVGCTKCNGCEDLCKMKNGIASERAWHGGARMKHFAMVKTGLLHRIRKRDMKMSEWGLFGVKDHDAVELERVGLASDGCLTVYAGIAGTKRKHAWCVTGGLVRLGLQQICIGEKVDAQHRGRGLLYPGTVEAVNKDGTYAVKFEGKELQKGDKIMALNRGRGRHYPSKIYRENRDGTYWVKFENGDFDKKVAAADIEGAGMDTTVGFTSIERKGREAGCEDLRFRIPVRGQSGGVLFEAGSEAELESWIKAVRVALKRVK